MKKLLTIFATFAMLCAVGCEEQGGGDDIDPNDKTEQPNEKPEDPIPENIFFGLDKESVSISPDGGSVNVIVYSNYKWEISGASDWCTPSVKSGEANEDGQKVSFSADVAYDNREATFWFRCANEKIKFTVSQSLKEVIIADENNTFNIPAEGGIATLAYQTSVDCEVVIPEEAKNWITIAPANTRGLVAENINLDIAENTTYSARSAVVKVVMVGNEELVVEYTINQEQNDAIIADTNNTFTVPCEGGNVTIDYQTNVECEIIIPEEAQDWLSLAPATRALEQKSATIQVAENTTYSARSAVVKVVKKGDNSLYAEYTINQVQNDAFIADENKTFTVPSEGGNVTIDYQTNVECEIIIPKEAQNWLSLAPATRALEQKSATINVAENTTYSARSAVVKVVKKGDNSLCSEYTINQEQNDAIIADGDNTFTVNYKENQITIRYKTNVSCEVIIPTEAQEWISIVSANTRALIQESTTLNIAKNNSGIDRSATIQVIAADNKKPIAEYIITQTHRYIIQYTSTDGNIVTPDRSSAWGAEILLNTYWNGVGIIEFDGPITSIGKDAFFKCSSLASINIPDSVTSIGSSAFENCTSLASVTIGNGVTSIGYDAFYGCSSLASINIPDSVTEIGSSAFSGCSSLAEIKGRFASSDGKCLIVDGELNSFAPAGLTDYTIPDSVTSIGDSAFDGCKSLASVTIGDSVTSIGNYAFWGCSSLTSVTIPDSVTSIGDNAFRSCTSLASVTIGDSVTSIGEYAFYKCSSLASVTIPDSVTSIGDWAFFGCSSLPVENGIRYADVYLVEAVNNDQDAYTVKEGTRFIGNDAFNHCKSLTGVAIPNSVISIGEYAFSSCSSLASVTIGNSVTSIGNSAFKNCSSLASVTIPDSVTSIGYHAFYNCSSLASVYCKPTTPPSGGYDMFYSNASGRSIYVPRASENAYKSAECWKDYASYIVGYDF